MNLNKLLKNKNLKEMMVFLVLFLGVFYIFYINVNQLRNKYYEIENKKKENETNFIREQKMSTITDRLEYAKDKEFVFDKVFISQEKQVKFITKLEEIAENNNVSQKISLNKWSKYKDDIFTMELTGNINGSMNNIQNYIDRLNNIIYFINIENITITSSNSNTEDNKSKIFNLNYKAKTYWK